MVCKSSGQVLSIRYNQHGWNTIHDCTINNNEQCKMKDSHPLVSVALFSHASYPVASDNILYTKIPVPFIYNARGIYLVDRTVETSNKTWVPNPNNVKLFPYPEDVNNNTAEDAWTAYAGTWGANSHPKLKTEYPFCFDDNITKIIACPEPDEDPIWDINLELLGLKGSPGHPLFFDLLRSFTQAGAGPKGPIGRDSFRSWIPAQNSSLVLNDTNHYICPNPEDWQ
eukprot:Pgem_evm1s1902